VSEATFAPPFARSDEVTHPMPAKGGGGGMHPKPPSPDSNRGDMRGSHPRNVRILPEPGSSIEEFTTKITKDTKKGSARPA
jgi:hypothetical protein